MRPNLQQLSITDIGNLLHRLPSINTANFRLTDYEINTYFSGLDKDLYAYLLKMELLESWTIESQTYRGSKNIQDLQRTLTEITESIKSISALSQDFKLNLEALFALMAAVNVRKFLYILRFLSTASPQVIHALISGPSSLSADGECLRYRLKMIYRANEIRRIYSSDNIQELNAFLLELDQND